MSSTSPCDPSECGTRHQARTTWVICVEDAANHLPCCKEPRYRDEIDIQYLGRVGDNPDAAKRKRDVAPDLISLKRGLIDRIGPI